MPQQQKKIEMQIYRIWHAKCERSKDCISKEGREKKAQKRIQKRCSSRNKGVLNRFAAVKYVQKMK